MRLNRRVGSWHPAHMAQALCPGCWCAVCAICTHRIAPHFSAAAGPRSSQLRMGPTAGAPAAEAAAQSPQALLSPAGAGRSRGAC